MKKLLLASGLAALMGTSAMAQTIGASIARFDDNFLTDNDPAGGEWIKFNRAPVKEGEGRARTGRRRRG